MRYIFVLLSLLIHICFVAVLLSSLLINRSMHGQITKMEVELVHDINKFKFSNTVVDTPKEIKASLKKKIVATQKFHPQKSSPVSSKNKIFTDTSKVIPHKHVPEIKTDYITKVDNKIILKQGKGITVGNSTIVLKRGSESRTFDSVAAYSFDEDDFYGHYETYGGKSMAIIDGRNSLGALYFYNPATGMKKELHKAGYGEFIYTYDDESGNVSGTIIFLPGDGQNIKRFMWMPAKGVAEFPIKAEYSVKEVGGVKIFTPPAHVKAGLVVFQLGDKIVEDVFSEILSQLASKGISCVLCSSLNNLSDCIEILRNEANVPDVGIWFKSYGLKRSKPFRIPELDEDFLIITFNCPNRSTDISYCAPKYDKSVPVMVGLKRVPDSWEEQLKLYNPSLRSAPNMVAVIGNPNCPHDNDGADWRWNEMVTGSFVPLIVRWIASLKE